MTKSKNIPLSTYTYFIRPCQVNSTPCLTILISVQQFVTRVNCNEATHPIWGLENKSTRDFASIKTRDVVGNESCSHGFSQTLFAISHEIRPIKFKFLNNKTECLAWKSSQWWGYSSIFMNMKKKRCIPPAKWLYQAKLSGKHPTIFLDLLF